MATLQEIDQYKVVIHCPTYEQAKWLHARFGDRILLDRWGAYKENTGFYFHKKEYCRIAWYEQYHYKIIPASSLLMTLKEL